MSHGADLFAATVGVGDGKVIAGVDEAGRGPLAGPVVAAAVILDPRQAIVGLKDSKQLSPKRREMLAGEIKAKALGFAYGRAEVEEIDRNNILAAALAAMCRAVNALPMAPDAAWVDGNIAPALSCPVVTVVRGDAKVAAIAAASILAKTSRDAEMAAFGERHPEYGFERHKGYATRRHLAALKRHGPCDIHRLSFAPLRRPEAQLELA